jgi:hypothetical protein
VAANGATAVSAPGARHAATAAADPVPASAAPQLVDGVDPAVHLRQAGLEVIDKRPVGRLWVVDSNPPSPALAALLKRGVRFVFARNGSRSTKHRPAWFMP